MGKIKLEVISASLSKVSYHAGDEICINLRFEIPPKDFSKINNISIDLHRVEHSRNQFVFGFGTIPNPLGNALEIKQKLPPEVFCRGLYFISAATLCWGGVEAKQLRVTFPPCFFAIQMSFDTPFTAHDVKHLVDDATVARNDFVNKEIHTDKSRNFSGIKKKYCVLVFGVGCLLHSRQQLEGYDISPLGLGFSHLRPHEIVNNEIMRLGLDPLEFDSGREANYERATPTFLVTYQTIIAVDHNDAITHCQSHTAILFDLLGLDRGQKPREFAYLASDLETGQVWYDFQQPWYKGNLVSDFNPVSTANMIEKHVHKLQSEPFLRLLIKTYSDATAEDDRGFALLRYWSVMELIADRDIKRGIKVKHPDGSLIIKSNGEPETTKDNCNLVYHYIFTSGGYSSTISCNIEGAQQQYMIGLDSSHPGYTPETELISLWDMVRAVYAVRNAIAHEGQFDLSEASKGKRYEQLAIRLIQGVYADPLNFIESQARNTILRELNKI